MIDGNQYSDVIKKFNYYKEKILKEFIQNGIYPDNSLINNKLKNIDMYLSIFNHNKIMPGDKFNTEEYNEYIKLIYCDFKILFELLQELQIQEFHKQQDFISSYTNELYSIVNTYKKRADFENSSTSLGKTLLFQDSCFKVNNDNSTTIIDLEDIKIKNASSIACIANINNIDADNLLFVFTDKSDTSGNTKYQIPPYNYSEELLIMPGKKNINVFNIDIPEEQKIVGPIILNINTTIDTNNKYTILGGKNKIFINYKDENSYKISNVPENLGSLILRNRTYINFYIVNGNSVSFKFNKKPISANFPLDEQKISSLDQIHHFFIECDKDFSFSIEIDKGEIYAIKEDGIVNNNKLYYTGSNIIRTFNIIEEKSGENKDYSVKLKIYNDNDNSFDIESIIIKEME